MGESIISSWLNPFANLALGNELIASALLVQSVSDGILRKCEPLYPVSRAYEDHVILHSMNKSIKMDNG